MNHNSNNNDSDLQWIKQQESAVEKAYAIRDLPNKNSLYSWCSQDELLLKYRVHSEMAKILSDEGISDLSGMAILDVGCGTGSLLRLFKEWGAKPEHLHGIDLLSDRIEQAEKLSDDINYNVGSGWELPYSDASMDIVTAFVVFSSIVEPRGRELLANEISRVIRPGGHALIYDFRISNPKNKNTVGISRRELERIFTDFTSVRNKTLVLAPPISRFLIRFGFVPVAVLEKLFPFLRTHILCYLSKDA